MKTKYLISAVCLLSIFSIAVSVAIAQPEKTKKIQASFWRILRPLLIQHYSVCDCPEGFKPHGDIFVSDLEACQKE